MVRPQRPGRAPRTPGRRPGRPRPGRACHRRRPADIRPDRRAGPAGPRCDVVGQGPHSGGRGVGARSGRHGGAQPARRRLARARRVVAEHGDLHLGACAKPRPGGSVVAASAVGRPSEAYSSPSAIRSTTRSLMRAGQRGRHRVAAVGGQHEVQRRPPTRSTSRSKRSTSSPRSTLRYAWRKAPKPSSSTTTYGQTAARGAVARPASGVGLAERGLARRRRPPRAVEQPVDAFGVRRLRPPRRMVAGPRAGPARVRRSRVRTGGRRPARAARPGPRRRVRSSWVLPVPLVPYTSRCPLTPGSYHQTSWACVSGRSTRPSGPAAVCEARRRRGLSSSGVRSARAAAGRATACGWSGIPLSTCASRIAATRRWRSVGRSS